jgi:aldose sugar dehydrogenase
MTRHPYRGSFCAAVAAAVACGLPAAAETEGPALSATTVLSGLSDPWDMAFLDDGTMFFTEKCDGLSVRMPDGEVNKLLGMEETEDYASTADDLFCLGQAGMMGVAVDPEFDDNRHIYVYSTSNMSDPHTNRVMRLTVNDDLTEVSDRTDIVDDIPYKMAESDHPFGGAGAHNGGRVRFGPDGYLFVTTGDNHLGEGPQSPTILAGKVLRVDRDGNAAEGNNAPDGFDERIFGYGFRNVQGIAFRPSDDAVFIAEHGPWHSDEITKLEPGGNGGWDPRPNMAGREDCPDDYCGYSPNQMEGMDPEERAAYMPMTDLETYPDALPPAWNNNMLSQGTSSAAFLEGEQWGDWEGKMAVGIMGIGFGGTPVGQRIDLVDLTDDGLDVHEVMEMPLPEGLEPGRFRSVVQGPDGDLYVAVDEGDITRISPE